MSFEMLREVYTIFDDSDNPGGYRSPKVKINKEGAKLIWQAYKDMWKGSQEMEGRESRGGIAYASEIEEYILKGHLPVNFKWEDYKIEKEK